MKRIKNIYFHKRFYIALTGIALLFAIGYFLPIVFIIARLAMLSFGFVLLLDFVILFSNKQGVFAKRVSPPRLSNGDENEIKIIIENNYAVEVSICVVDEIPYQFQQRNFSIKLKMPSRAEKELSYNLKPLERGEYNFGITNVYVSSIFRLVQRRFRFGEPIDVPVYPSFIQMRKYEFLAISNRMEEVGIKKVRQKGTHSEFDQVREYVQGDDYRTMNWKATARRGALMVNQYQDEKSKEVYCIVDKGRVMKMPFEGMTLLDYSINASLILSNIALIKHDKAGLITYNKEIDSIVQADRKTTQLHKIMEVLYNQQTTFEESNTELLYLTLKKKIHQRSLLILFTNFESVVSVRRFMAPLASLSRNHLVLVVVYENTEIEEMSNGVPKTDEQIYEQVIAQKFIFEKKLIIRELNQCGVHAILTKPANLNVNLINKYLEFKSLGMM